MFYEIEAKSHVRVPPGMFKEDIRAAIVKELNKKYDKDIIASAKNEKESLVIVFHMKRGILAEKDEYRFKSFRDFEGTSETSEEELSDFRFLSRFIFNNVGIFLGKRRMFKCF